jgi:hypothetical protein
MRARPWVKPRGAKNGSVALIDPMNKRKLLGQSKLVGNGNFVGASCRSIPGTASPPLIRSNIRVCPSYANNFNPDTTSTAARAGRNHRSEARLESKLPAMTPGIEPIRRLASNMRLTSPITQWPMPPSSVSGTAWAISVPTMRANGMFGYSINSAVTPIAPAPTDETDTATPMVAPSRIVGRIDLLGRFQRAPSNGEFPELALKCDRNGCEHEHAAERRHNNVLRRLSHMPSMPKRQQCKAGRWDTAAREAAHDFPIDGFAPAVDTGSKYLGGSRVKKIGTHRCLGAHAEHQHEQWRHQRTAPDPCQTHQNPDKQAS